MTETIIRSQRAARRNIQRLHDQFNAEKATITETDARALKKEIDDAKTELEGYNKNLLEATTNDNDYDTAYDEIQRQKGPILRLLQEIDDKLRSFQRQPTGIDNETHRPTSSTAVNVTKLPTLDLPTFDGIITDWMAFSDQFKTAVTKNETLSASQRLIYLKSLMKGEPARMIRHIPTTDQNFEIAWNILEERYKNDRVILQTLLKKIFELKSASQENLNQLQVIHSTFSEVAAQVKAIGRDVENDTWYYLLQSKLDSETQKDWAMERKGKDILQYNDLIKFVNDKIKAMEANSFFDTRAQKSSSMEPKQLFPATKSEREKPACSTPNCTAKHELWACEKFRSKQPHDRREIVKQANRCFNCLRAGHMVASCPSESNCKTCRKRHHSMLHESRNQEPAQMTCCANPSETTVSILPTAVVKVQASNGRQVTLRAMVDTGAQVNAVTKQACSKLKIRPQTTQERITGVSQTDSQPALGEVNLFMKTNDRQGLNIKCLVLPSIAAGNHPRQEIDSATVKQLQSFKLADDRFWEPGPIDLLLGVGIIPKIIRSRNVKINDLCLTDTSLGWTIAGQSNSFDAEPVDIPKSISFCQLEKQNFERFWEVEDVPTCKEAKFTKEENECVKHYNDTTIAQDCGRPMVRLPFKVEKSLVCPKTGDLMPNIGHSSKKALSQFLRNEHKLSQCESARKQYVDFFKEMMDMKHIEEVLPDEDNLPPEKHFVMPHHAVWKEDSTTTKCRAVFNGSAKTTNGVSLNDCLLVGPNQQPTLFETIVKFRFYAIALSGDVSKMYRQVALNPKDRNYHQFYWRSHSNDPIKKWRFTVVIYGVTSASYHAIRALRSGADHAKTAMGGCEILHSFYVDDMCGGGDSDESVIIIYADVSEALKSIGMEVRKWASNSPQVMKNIPEHLHENQDLFLADITHSIKSLGMRWKPKTDLFHYKPITNSHVPHYSKTTAEQSEGEKLMSNQNDNLGPITRRIISSNMSKVFDPIGLVTPVTLQPKILFQQTWDGNLDWDDPVDNHISTQFKQWMEELKHLTEVQIPRFVASKSFKKAELHLFCDASSQAYGATVYIRTLGDEINVRLLTAKSRLAPRKTISIPRLELCSMVLGVKLMAMVKEAINPIGIELDCYGWSDSTISLAWIKSEPCKFSTFVSNRIAKVQKLLNSEHWRHVPTHLNPADHTTRPIDPQKLAELSIWWNGPKFLSSEPIDQPEQPEHIQTDKLQELAKRPPPVITVVSQRDTVGRDPIIDMKKYGSLRRVIQVLFNVLKFIHICRKKTYVFGELHRETIRLLLKQEQADHFDDEINLLKKHQPVKKSSRISQLYPFIDNDGLMKVGGRLAAADCLTEEAKYQIILPSNSHLSKLIVTDAHKRLLHCGVNATVTETRQQFWILKVKSLAKSVIAQCVTCFRYNCRLEAQLMGDLPSERVNPSPPFSHVGIDFAGPIMISKGKSVNKTYIVVFVCLATKAIHLDIAQSLETKEFELVLKRFIARRGCPDKIYSDNATNFIGTRNDLIELRKLLMSENEKHAAIPQKVIDIGINWETIPPKAPNFGGLWEAAVKSMKLLLRKTIGHAKLNQWELYTVLFQIEAILNSRPLTAIQENSGDISPITPNMLITGFRKTQIPVILKPTKDLTPGDPLQRYELLKTLVQEFWKRWRHEYLTSLQTRMKQKKETPNLKIDDIVLITDDNVPPFSWPLGRIIEVYTGNDNLVRVAKVKSGQKMFIRPTIKLRKLPLAHKIAITGHNS